MAMERSMTPPEQAMAPKRKHKMLCRSRWVWDSDFNKRTGELKKGYKPLTCDCGAARRKKETR